MNHSKLIIFLGMMNTKINWKKVKMMEVNRFWRKQRKLNDSNKKLNHFGMRHKREVEMRQPPRTNTNILKVFNELFNLIKFIEENIRLKETVTKLEESLEKAAKVIEEYSNAAGEDHCSAAELLQLRHELERVQAENQRLHSKMDQFKHEATQEQRLITQHWYQSVSPIFF